MSATHSAPLTQENEVDEIDVTEIIERIEALEEENTAQKEKIEKLEARISDCETSIDTLAGIVGEL